MLLPAPASDRQAPEIPRPAIPRDDGRLVDASGRLARIGCRKRVSPEILAALDVLFPTAALVLRQQEHAITLPACDVCIVCVVQNACSRRLAPALSQLGRRRLAN